MSFSTLSALSSLLSELTGWRVQLMPGSFRGVPFYLNVAPGEGGRRLVTHQFPQIDTPLLEDLGQEANVYQLQVFVVGEGYAADRDALIAACQGYNTPDVLVHPTLGIIVARAGKLTWSENPAEKGGYCSFDIAFHRDGTQPTTLPDTASQVLAGISSMLQVASAAYQAISLISQFPALLVGFAGGLLGSAGDALMALPPATTVGLATQAAAMSETVTSDAGTAGAVQTALQTAAASVVTAQTPPVATDDPVLGTAPLFAPVADLTGGLASLGTWGDTLTQPMGAGAVLEALQAQQVAIAALVEGSVLLAIMAIYAQTDFSSANAAAAARGQLLDLIDRQSEAANLAGNDNLYRAWQALGMLAMKDLIARAQNLPSLIAYSVGSVRSSLVLAQLFYQDTSRAGQLAALNDVPHPMFMPATGIRLSV